MTCFASVMYLLVQNFVGIISDGSTHLSGRTLGNVLGNIRCRYISALESGWLFAALVVRDYRERSGSLLGVDLELDRAHLHGNRQVILETTQKTDQWSNFLVAFSSRRISGGYFRWNSFSPQDIEAKFLATRSGLSFSVAFSTILSFGNYSAVK